MNGEIEVINPTNGALSIGDLREQVNLIQHVMKEVMQDGEHYGVIPGTKKPTLLKAGAEKLCLVFRLDPQYETTERTEGTHLTVVSKCTLFHIPTGKRLGSGMGSCSTRESKYAYRQASKKCPRCNGEFIIKGKDEYGGGWLCFVKKGGCGATFKDGDKEIEGQASGRVPNEDVADQYNTILKMSNKRSLVAAVLNVTAASDIFTQDLEEMPADAVSTTKVEKKPTEEVKPPATPTDAETIETPYNGDEPSGRDGKTKRAEALESFEKNIKSTVADPKWITKAIKTSKFLKPEDKASLLEALKNRAPIA